MRSDTLFSMPTNREQRIILQGGLVDYGNAFRTPSKNFSCTDHYNGEASRKGYFTFEHGSIRGDKCIQEIFDTDMKSTQKSARSRTSVCVFCCINGQFQEI